MSRAGIDRFVQFFERTSRQALRSLPAIADRVVSLDAWRRPVPSAASGPGAAGPTIAP
jgi:D-glycerate 3-kinase